MFGNGLRNGAACARTLFVIGLLYGVAPCARAASAYRCHGPDGVVAYQDRPCEAAQRETRVELAPEPPPAPSPDYGVAPARRAAVKHAPSRSPARRQAPSHECRSDDGEVFYRHGACPKSIRAGKAGGAAAGVAVSAVELSRAEACRRIAAAGSVGRRGRDRDERVSTYERNAGRDPCRAE